MHYVKAILSCVGILFLQSAVVLAADQAETHTSMPQLDYTTFPSQIFWLLITFALLYFLISKSSVSKIVDVYEERQNRIDADIKIATSSKQEAEQVLQSYEKALSDARSQAKEMIKKAKKECSSTSNQQLQEFHQKMNKDLDQAETRIHKIKEDAMQDVSAMAEEITDDILRKLVGSASDPSLIKEAIQQLKAA